MKTLTASDNQVYLSPDHRYWGYTVYLPDEADETSWTLVPLSEAQEAVRLQAEQDMQGFLE